MGRCKEVSITKSGISGFVCCFSLLSFGEPLNFPSEGLAAFFVASMIAAWSRKDARHLLMRPTRFQSNCGINLSFRPLLFPAYEIADSRNLLGCDRQGLRSLVAAALESFEQ